MKITSLSLGKDTVTVGWSTAEKQEVMRCKEPARPELYADLQALNELIHIALNVTPSWADPELITVIGASWSYTQAGTGSIAIIFERIMNHAGTEVKQRFRTLHVQYDQPREDEPDASPFTDYHREAVNRLLEEALRYVRGERAQMQLEPTE